MTNVFAAALAGVLSGIHVVAIWLTVLVILGFGLERSHG